MIEIKCGCAAARKLPETTVGKRFRCPSCSQTIQLVSGETLTDGAGEGDFDAELTVTAGQLSGVRFILGGVAEIEVGKLPDRHIYLPGTAVSRIHCKLIRVDFGPSRWKVVDNHSTNGLYINNQRVSEHELEDGDQLTIGEYKVRFNQTAAIEKPKLVTSLRERAGMGRASSAAAPAFAGRAGAAVVTGPAKSCPSCDKTLSASAKICVDCGINLDTGRPVLTTQDVDENSLYESAYQWIRLVSLLVWVTPMPIPIRSEAFGTRKPYTIWTIAILTTLASILFFIAQSAGSSGESPFDRPGKDLMLWSPSAQSSLVQLDPVKIHDLARHLTDEERQGLRELAEDPQGRLSDDQLVKRELETLAPQVQAARGEFHWYQLITHAFLHDTSSIFNFAMHLGGNMLFMLVFGTRVNALIGNLATALLYPVLAICAACAQLMFGDSSGPMLGASGAIMGLAGMYLILFPVHRVFCAMWISIWLRFRRIFGCKIFQLRGFWVLLSYFGWDITASLLSSHFGGGGGGGVAHWAHIGGFSSGAILGLGILCSRMFNTGGSDVLSVTLGKHAWPLIGKPNRWQRATPGLPRATSLNFN